MTDKEYEQKKQRCWEEYVSKHGLKNAIPEDAFSFTFDRAYALGKLQASGGQVKETISQDFHYKQNKAKKAAKPKFKIGQYVIYKGSKAQILNYHKRWEYPYYILLPGKDAYAKESELDIESESESTVIQGWVARDKDGLLSLFRLYRPERGYDYNGEFGEWGTSIGYKMTIPNRLFPDLTWDDDPIEVEIIIKRKKNAI